MFRFLLQDHHQNSKYIDREKCILLAVAPVFQIDIAGVNFR